VSVAEAAALIRAGKLVAFPTETVYGLGANALDAAAVARIFAVKGRPRGSPLIVHVDSLEMARGLALDWPDGAERLARKYWPGPLTLVLRKHPSIPDIVTAGLATVGLRVPAHPLALALIRAAGVPIAAPSANLFTELSPTTAGHVRQSLGDAVDYVLDGGATTVGIESTVLSLVEPRPALLRPGVIPIAPSTAWKRTPARTPHQECTPATTVRARRWSYGAPAIPHRWVAAHGCGSAARCPPKPGPMRCCSMTRCTGWMPKASIG